MKRLYRKVYLTILGSLLLVVVLSGLIWQFGGQRPPVAQALAFAAELITASLPPADAPVAEQQAAVEALALRLKTNISLFDSSRALVASSGPPLRPPSGDADGGWSYGKGGPAWVVPLTDGRWLVASAGHHRNPLLLLLLFLGAIALAVGVSAYPVVRGLTRRLERLQAGVETLGAGDLAARVPVQGRDEVARLAEAFNRAAARIEELVGAHRMLLANASHELRTPLSRIRLGLDLLERRPDEKLKAEINADIAELDRLIDEILLASRLDAAPALSTSEEVDLQALAAEECARYDECELDGDAAVVSGDPRLLRRLIRNLLENAERHGRPPVLVTTRKGETTVTLRVEDQGRGIAPADRDRIFTPFTRAAGDERGAGLGLSLVRQIARLHGGEAAVADDPATGRSGFEVTLPTRR
ncbi:MAG TPA: HAMP domain-containing sensor histidine kinase [Bauldia sp.]|nr:HAMP domain-containing sensor histidine kinase [Bauldia sp.]